MALASSPQLWAWIAIAAAIGYLLWLLAPILAPILVVALALIVLPLFLRHLRAAYMAGPLDGDR